MFGTVALILDIAVVVGSLINFGFALTTPEKTGALGWATAVILSSRLALNGGRQ